VLAHELLAQADVLVRKLFLADRRGSLVKTGLPEMFTGRGATDRILPLGAAALRADVATNARTVPPRASFAAKFARDTHRRISLSYHRDMRRTDLYLKVELYLDDKEQPEKLAAEICRMIRKVYGVRSAEVSSMIEKDG
jgi:hypothetical protein